MITITLNQIKAHEPCEGGWWQIVEAAYLHGDDYDKPFPLAAALETNGLDHVLWALRCLPEHDNLWRKFAVWCARQVQHLMTDERSITALDVAWRHSNGEATNDELKAAWAAAWDAVDALASGDAAWSAAWVAALVAQAARDAALAAQAALASGDAAWAAARDARGAALAAARATQESKLRQILEAGEWVDD